MLWLEAGTCWLGGCCTFVRMILCGGEKKRLLSTKHTSAGGIRHSFFSVQNTCINTKTPFCTLSPRKTKVRAGPGPRLRLQPPPFGTLGWRTPTRSPGRRRSWCRGAVEDPGQRPPPLPGHPLVPAPPPQGSAPPGAATRWHGGPQTAPGAARTQPETSDTSEEDHLSQINQIDTKTKMSWTKC